MQYSRPRPEDRIGVDFDASGHLTAGLERLGVPLDADFYICGPTAFLRTGLHLTPADAGWIASANYLGYLIGALAAAGGWAHGRERLLMLVSLAASAVLAALTALAGCGSSGKFAGLNWGQDTPPPPPRIDPTPSGPPKLGGPLPTRPVAPPWRAPRPRRS